MIWVLAKPINWTHVCWWRCGTKGSRYSKFKWGILWRIII